MKLCLWLRCAAECEWNAELNIQMRPISTVFSSKASQLVCKRDIVRKEKRKKRIKLKMWECEKKTFLIFLSKVFQKRNFFRQFTLLQIKQEFVFCSEPGRRHTQITRGNFISSTETSTKLLVALLCAAYQREVGLCSSSHDESMHFYSGSLTTCPRLWLTQHCHCCGKLNNYVQLKYTHTTEHNNDVPVAESFSTAALRWAGKISTQ